MSISTPMYFPETATPQPMLVNTSALIRSRAQNESRAQKAQTIPNSSAQSSFITCALWKITGCKPASTSAVTPGTSPARRAPSTAPAAMTSAVARKRLFALCTEIAALQNARAARFHFFNGKIDISRRQIDAPTHVDDQKRFEAELARVEHAIFDAVIGREPAEVNIGHTALLQIIAQTSGAPMRVVEKRAITVDLGINPFLENAREAVRLESRRECRARRVVHAMNRPG